jgi:hypothetical protein
MDVYAPPPHNGEMVERFLGRAASSRTLPYKAMFTSGLAKVV